jgi:hypothetical protein
MEVRVGRANALRAHYSGTYKGYIEGTYHTRSTYKGSHIMVTPILCVCLCVCVRVYAQALSGLVTQANKEGSIDFFS